MNYTWNWGVLSQSTGVGDETYLDWIVSGLGWLLTIGSIAWIIAICLGTVLGATGRHFVCHRFSQYPLIGAIVCLVLRGAYLVAQQHTTVVGQRLGFKHHGFDFCQCRFGFVYSRAYLRTSAHRD